MPAQASVCGIIKPVHHDLWDYDLPSAPQLITVNRNGKKIDAVAVGTKHGFVFVFDRVTGEPVFPIEEKSFSAKRDAWREIMANTAYFFAPKLYKA
jgi:glucose dehydrogenase